MTPDHPLPDATAVPPPGCPAHRAAAHGGGARFPLYGRTLAGHELPTLYERLRRRHGPVAPVTIGPGLEAWLVMGYRELLHLCRDERLFSRDSRRWAPLREGRVPTNSPLTPFVAWRPAVLWADGEQHRRQRAAVTDALGRVDGHGLAQVVELLARRLISRFAARQEADLVPHYAQRLPVLVLSRLLGLDEREGLRLGEAVAGTAAAHADSPNASGRMGDMLRALVRARRHAPRGDVASWLLRHPARLSEDEVLHNLAVMLVAGHQTMRNWIATTCRVLLTDPGFHSSLTAGHVTVDDALDLVLWHLPPTQHFPARYATRDVRFGGRDIAQGDMLLLGLAAVHGDPTVLPPGGRPAPGNRAHLAFGAGPHTCPAQDLARLVTHGAVDTVRRLLPDMALTVPADELPWTTSPWTTGLASLPVRFSAPAPSTLVLPGGAR